MKEKKSQKKLQKKSLKTLPIALVLLIAIILVIAFIVNQSQKSNVEMTPQQIRTEAYNQVQSGEDGTSAVKFDAYFTNADGSRIRGTCSEIGKDSNLYMELKLVQEGQLKDATITINADNFYFNTAILKDDVISQSYISSNTKTIKLNEINSTSARI